MQKKDSTTTLDTNNSPEDLKLHSKRVHLRNNNSSGNSYNNNKIVGFPQSEAQTMPEGQIAHLGWKIT